MLFSEAAFGFVAVAVALMQIVLYIFATLSL